VIAGHLLSTSIHRRACSCEYAPRASATDPAAFMLHYHNAA